MKEIRLYGHLGKKFGKSFFLAVNSPGEAIKALSANIKGFREYLISNSGLGYHVFIDKKDIGVEEIHNPISKEIIKIIPVVYGSGGFFKIILGTVLAFIPGMGGLGLSMILSGISEVLFAPPKLKNQTGKQKLENTPSYVFNGVVNTTAQGNAVPLCYGKLRIGSQVISAGMSDKQLKTGNTVVGGIPKIGKF